MTVTVLVPVYGVEKYMEKCAESLFSQTYGDIRYVFCDDCTPDSSMEILNEVLGRFPGKRENVTVIRNDRNLGLGGTRRHLFEYLESEAFMLVDSDDFLPPEAVGILVERMKETRADTVDGAYRETATGAVRLPFHGSGGRFKRRILCQEKEKCRVWGKLYRTEAVKRIGTSSFEGIDMAEDLCFTSRVVDCCSRSWTDRVVYEYRTDNPSSYTGNINEKAIRSYIRACNVVYGYYSERGAVCPSLETGMVNVLRQCRKFGFPVERAAAELDYSPTGPFFRLLTKMVAAGSPAADIVYRTVRALCAL